MPRVHYKEDDVRRLLDAGMSNAEIGRRLRMERTTVGRIRRHLGYPDVTPGPAPMTLMEKWERDTTELPHGHRLWTGERSSGGSPVLSLNGKKITVGRAAYFIRHGRWPESRVLSGCEHGWCIAPGHVATSAERDAPMQEVA
ncbi:MULTISPECIES: hypothetical protein [Streptomyces]|uniref:hypothetical protein n=1 Tax=Streptomyces lycopersici TaxID=2974589 RepID=UPI0021D18630|nr:hypothetical protein [Streptomyces sp. NEAU-383]